MVDKFIDTKNEKSNIKTVFSGIQPTGHLHIGNYLGAIQKWTEIQNTHDCIFCAVDLHALTTQNDNYKNKTEDYSLTLKEQTRQTIAMYVACGIDPKKNILFPQSAVPFHTELSWILTCITPLGWLNRMTQFKNKTQDLSFDNISLGLYSYPTLMAADILLYDTDFVPVGDDQKQHLEFTNKLASIFNNMINKYHDQSPIKEFKNESTNSTINTKVENTQNYFKLPKILLNESATRVMSLQDGTKKMSKSDPSELSRINLNDDEATIIKKIKKAKSDEYTNFDPETLNDRPEAQNLIKILSSLTEKTVMEICKNCDGKGFGYLKQELITAICNTLLPIQNKSSFLSNDELDKIIENGTERAYERAQKQMKKIKELLGIFDFQKLLKKY